MDFVQLITELSYQYGPFLFAVLFTLVISKRARKAYHEVVTRSEPPATGEERTTYRRIYIGTFVFAVVLVIASVTWWMFNQTYHHVFIGSIVDLKDHEQVSSMEMYFRPILHPHLEQLPQMRDEEFVLVQDGSIPSTRMLDVYYSKGGGHIQKFEVCCKDGSGSKYRVVWSDSLHTNVLERISSTGEHASVSGNIVWAAEQGEQSLFRHQVPFRRDSSARFDPVTVLQDERSDVGSKIVAIDRMLALDDDSLRIIARINTDKEPMAQTLLDLTRHSDKELAYKARVLADERCDIEGILAEQLKSEDAEKSEQAQQILLRTDSAKASAILMAAEETGSVEDKQKIEQLKMQIQEGSKSAAVVPTASIDGDRYYVRATWEPSDTTVVDCLTELFNSEPGHNRTMEDEKAIMNDKSERIVWWYSKEWALWIAERIKECGGTAAFVGF
ncbi:MAG: hypothetical protein JSU74_10355 [Candidatus Zixiibacteriota bacterium]|nr:MAG: hypothetical protein JSU74_10355 [candidate division Zixibacteria bacterium]